jgi:hypothetical protein
MAWHSFRFRFVYNGNCSAGRIEIAVLDEFPVNPLSAVWIASESKRQGDEADHSFDFLGKS